MNRIDEIKELLLAKRFQPVRYGRGASDLEVRAAEAELRLQFPESYKAFLKNLGWIRSPYISVYGLGPDADAYDLVRTTTWEREESGLPLPPNLLPVVNDGSGNLYCLDTFQTHNSECPVVFWDHESYEGADQIPTVVGPDFNSWFIKEIKALGAD